MTPRFIVWLSLCNIYRRACYPSQQEAMSCHLDDVLGATKELIEAHNNLHFLVLPVMETLFSATWEGLGTSYPAIF